ncbi:ABC transporter permease [Tepidibacter formicigenes]|jgi:ABC-type multidrug transport system permease subunit|uniref:Transport permease protein n=1 Tax=Tepidibacter formicigenes DSM 15518 TaxID=1123349 RepID=A0A1M6S6T8_9FIRM|nr:ABC transporter permease [Tepidibacter formicigenes]SHK40369.1 ABC-type polysaccharide/polyol phosphate export permease [Tepidibacter formicigenes DSM 15518]
MEVGTILWREFIFFKRKAFKITAGAVMSPLLYLIAFGWGLGDGVIVEGHSYIYFIIPGIIALSTMHTSFNAVSIRITVAKLHEKSFEYYMTAPVKMYLLTLGYVIAGALRGLYAGFIILIVSYMFGVHIHFNIAFILVCFLNSMLFAAFGYTAAMIIDNHYDMNRFTTFVITPMTFLCGTFFSLDKMPIAVKKIIMILPLTHVTESLRGIALVDKINYISILVLLVYFMVFFAMGVYVSYKEIK